MSLKDLILDTEKFIYSSMLEKLKEERGLFHSSPDYSEAESIEHYGRKKHKEREIWEEYKEQADQDWNTLLQEVSNELGANEELVSGDYRPKLNPENKELYFEFEEIDWTKEKWKILKQIFRKTKEKWDEREYTRQGEVSDILKMKPRRKGFFSWGIKRYDIIRTKCYPDLYNKFSGTSTSVKTLARIRSNGTSLPLSKLEPEHGPLVESRMWDYGKFINDDALTTGIGLGKLRPDDNKQRRLLANFLEKVGEEVFGASES